MPALFSTREIAALFNVTETTIKRWADEGTITCVKTVGGHRKFLLKDVVRFSEESGYPMTGSLSPPKSRKLFETLEFNIHTANYRKISDLFLHEALQQDRSGVADLLSYLCKNRISFATIGDEVIRPAMIRIGELWATGTLEVNQEHLASGAVMEALLRVSADLHRKSSNGLSAACACAEGDYHEIGLRILAYTLESEGWSVQYLGANTPFDTLNSFVKIMEPDLVCLSSTLHKSSGNFTDKVRSTGRLVHAHKGMFIVGGFYTGDYAPKDLQCDYISTSAHDAVAFVRDKFRLKPGPKKHITAPPSEV